MTKVVKLKKGLNINIKGKAVNELVDSSKSNLYAIMPTEFPGIIPKLLVKPDHVVKAGTPLFFNKHNPEVKFTSPVSGKVIAVERGARRKILRIVVEADAELQYEDFKKGDLSSLKREDVVDTLLNSGVWPFIRQRPYAIIANSKDTPKAIFISGFDNAPIAPDYNFILKDQLDEFQNGVNALAKLTEGKIHLNLDGEKENIFSSINGVEVNQFFGKHPSSTIGTQISHVDPINKGEIVWYVNPQDVVIIGKLFSKGIYDAKRILALTGSQVNAPKYYNTMVGAKMETIAKDNVNEDNSRYITGNVLTGTQTEKDLFLSFYDSQVSVIPEGNYYEFFGWIMPRFNKFSMSKTYFSWLMPKKEYALDTNTNGGERAFVMTEQYEKVVPMDIYPVELLKACMAEDIDKMENLGIYEVAEEDLALCDYVCTSKTEAQETIRKGIDLMIKELS